MLDKHMNDFKYGRVSDPVTHMSVNDVIGRTRMDWK